MSKVLVADDSGSALALISQYLTEGGHTVIGATGVKKALTKALEAVQYGLSQ